MFYGIYLSAEGAHAQAKRLEVVAHNLANVDTPGFRRQLAIFEARASEATALGLEPPGSGSIQDLAGGIRVVDTALESAPGKLRHTGVPTDLAIVGEGFFVLDKGGEPVLTRAGNFSISPTGQLVAKLGGREYPVLSQAGQPVVVDPLLGPWEVTADGALRQGGMLQALAIVRPVRWEDLEPLGENLFRVRGQIEPLPEAQRSVRAGYLEESSVNPTMEMLALIETSRAVEANLNMMQLQEGTLAALVSRLLRVG
ncbi:MAG: flagellar hook basal-body protein [Thermoguttaceae bacterium]|nr:flagellar hook basal-body protein [Thermoguttaceae bacterium]MDW8079451.1 flagellar hook basal-body protein [Thermoguttaceae bacterium]